MKLFRAVAFSIVVVGLAAMPRSAWAWYDPTFSTCGSVNWGSSIAWLADCRSYNGLGYFGGESEAESDLQSDCSAALYWTTGSIVITDGHWENDTYYVVDAAYCW